MRWLTVWKNPRASPGRSARRRHHEIARPDSRHRSRALPGLASGRPPLPSGGVVSPGPRSRPAADGLWRHLALLGRDRWFPERTHRRKTPPRRAASQNQMKWCVLLDVEGLQLHRDEGAGDMNCHISGAVEVPRCGGIGGGPGAAQNAVRGIEIPGLPEEVVC